jgi:SsrA-binding protein
MPAKNRPSAAEAGDHIKMVAQNRRARHDFAIVEQVEAGLALVGSEVKSLRDANVNLSDAYGVPKGNELFLINAKIGTYRAGGAYGHTEPTRARKLLLHRRQVDDLIARVTQGGMTLVPLSIYFKNGRAKVELALCRGRTHEDRREDMKEREGNREIERALRPRGAKRRGRGEQGG